jgi:C-terminal processing protease CtpA/Prc
MDVAAPLLAIVLLAGLGIAKLEAADPTYGIGAVVAPDAPAGTPTLKAVVLDHINITQIISGSPADKSGLQKGDEIVQVDDKSLVGMKFYDVVINLIRGKEGTAVTITIKRNGQTTPLSFIIIRGGVPNYGLISR